MAGDLSLTPKAGLLALINAKSSVVATEANFQEWLAPQPIANAPAGQPNTEVTLRTNLEFSHAGRVTLQYTRLNLADFTQYQMSATVEDIGTLEQYLAMLSNRYGIYLQPTDIEPTTPFDVSGGELSYVYTFAAKPNSYLYYGQGQFVVKVNWRFDDPEWIEQNVSRLRTLVQIDMPSAVISFMQSV